MSDRKPLGPCSRQSVTTGSVKTAKPPKGCRRRAAGTASSQRPDAQFQPAGAGAEGIKHDMQVRSTSRSRGPSDPRLNTWTADTLETTSPRTISPEVLASFSGDEGDRRNTSTEEEVTPGTKTRDKARTRPKARRWPAHRRMGDFWRSARLGRRGLRGGVLPYTIRRRTIASS
jgi:hypothetical protein